LRTGDLRSARRLCRQLSNAMESLIGSVDGMIELDNQRIKSLVRGIFQKCLNDGEEFMILQPQDLRSDSDSEAVWVGLKIDALRKSLVTRKYDARALGDTHGLLKIIEASGEKVTPESVELLTHGVARAHLEHYRTMLRKLAGDHFAP